MTAPRPVDLRAVSRLQTLRDSLGSWRKVAANLGENSGTCLHVVKGTRRANAKMLNALGLAEKRNDIRIRMTLSDAREIVEHDTMPANVKNRIKYAMWGKK